MARTSTVRRYGKTARKTRADELFAQLPKSPEETEKTEEGVKKDKKRLNKEEVVVIHEDADDNKENVAPSQTDKKPSSDGVAQITGGLAAVDLNRTHHPQKERIDHKSQRPSATLENRQLNLRGSSSQSEQPTVDHKPDVAFPGCQRERAVQSEEGRDLGFEETFCNDSLPVLTWEDICATNRIEKIAEASYAEVYRVSNDHGTSILKVIRLESPIKPQTKAQQRSGLVDEDARSEEDMYGEMQISEWLSDIPGFVVYKSHYIVKGKAPKSLLETHQAFHRRMKRKDPNRLQFYPSPSRYLDDTKFLVIELGDAGIALEDFQLTDISQVWDIFLLTALALARAEDLIEFEHRDLHEGNLCIRRVRDPMPRPKSLDLEGNPRQFGFSGLDITILDYGLSRATCPYIPPSPVENTPPPQQQSSTNNAPNTLPPAPPKTSSPSQPTGAIVAYDLERDLSIFTSTHAPQCAVYRQMRSYLLLKDRTKVLAPEKHSKPYVRCLFPPFDPISWQVHEPYTNVLWLAYLYEYLVQHFKGDAKQLRRFKKETAEMWMHLDPDAPRGVLSFPSAGDVVRFAVEAGWIGEEQVVDAGMSGVEEQSIILDG
ncbi:uncharacterized protein CTHT_0024810 [Thermochaetoides thermophila DSM 1495]|uniref:non-specific serine/threonine protein kinase n=1 Tax=Chaetomium thermophilum (strain DSM 1495 / CBS 144.50 / IMI 039719) TaxID=759272 RepID=G0S5M6_CHATD|nr:hypothetical protein CTHT_0024810 [Thermochaetoides thermophila DSM 1495]EGS20645.1 hypothetical protein CTHT_0024810 [Thermochaetoides thermophila DSM 1495]